MPDIWVSSICLSLNQENVYNVITYWCLQKTERESERERRNGGNNYRLHFKGEEERKLLLLWKFPFVFLVELHFREVKALQSEEGKAVGSEQGKTLGSGLCHEERKGVEEALYCIWWRLWYWRSKGSSRVKFWFNFRATLLHGGRGTTCEAV